MSTEETERLVEAILRRDAEAIDRAPDDGADVNAAVHGMRPIHLAAMIGSQGALAALLRRGASVDARDRLGRTAIYWPAIGTSDDSTSIITRLLDAGANVNTIDNNGYTPLDLAEGAGHDKAIKLLKERGAIRGRRDGAKWIDVVDDRGTSPSVPRAP